MNAAGAAAYNRALPLAWWVDPGLSNTRCLFRKPLKFKRLYRDTVAGNPFEFYRHDPASSAFRNAPDRQPAPRQLPRRTEELDRTPVPVRLLFLHCRLPRPHDRVRRHPASRGLRVADGRRLAGRGPEPGGLHDVHPVPRTRARGAAPDALDDHAARLARARTDVQGPAGTAQGKGPGHLRVPGLSAAAERRHPAVPPDGRAGR